MDSNFNFSKEKNSDEEVDLFDILRIFKRRWQIVLVFIFSSLCFSVPYSLTRQKIWSGNFKIVIENTSNSGNNENSFLLSSLRSKNDLTTEILILESPLILKPVYNYSIKLDQENGIDNQGLTYEKWFTNKLSVNLLRRSNVLQITYKDQNKESIIPILEKISEAYQDYSKSDKERAINRDIIYSNKQLLEFKEKSKLSSRELDFYKMKYGINATTTLSNGTSNNSKLFTETLSVNDMFPSGSITNGNDLINYDSPLSKLSGINQELFKRRQYFKENDDSIQNLLNERKQLKKYIETTANGLIGLPNKDNLTKEEALEIIVKYKALKRAADRDINIVNNLENNLIKLKMNKARERNPWKLISTPRMPDSPIAPKKKKIVGYYLLFGFALGIIFALWKDKNSGYIYSFEKLQKILPFPIIHNIYSTDEIAIENHIKILLKGPLKDFDSIGLFCLGKFSNNFLDIYTSLLKKNTNQKKLIISKDISEIVNCSSQILITEIGNVKRDEIKIATEQLTLLKNNLIGMILKR